MEIDNLNNFEDTTLPTVSDWKKQASKLSVYFNPDDFKEKVVNSAEFLETALEVDQENERLRGCISQSKLFLVTTGNYLSDNVEGKEVNLEKATEKLLNDYNHDKKPN